MNCHRSFKNTLIEILHDKELDGRVANIPLIIQKDAHANWDRSHYDFGHYGGRSVAGHYNFKARYPIMLTPNRDNDN